MDCARLFRRIFGRDKKPTRSMVISSPYEVHHVDGYRMQGSGDFDSAPRSMLIHHPNPDPAATAEKTTTTSERSDRSDRSERSERL